MWTEHQSREISATDSVLNINTCINMIKDLNEEKILGRYYYKELLMSRLWNINK